MAQGKQDKVALVTGAGSGIGRASALAFARDGASVVVVDVDRYGGEQTVSLIEERAGTASFIEADVSRLEQVEAMVQTAIETYGRLDFAHNNAGIEGQASARGTVDCTEQNWDDTIDTNLKGVWLCMKYEIPRMLEQGSGAIVNTASVGGLVGLPGRPAYTASKHGLIGLTKAAALEYADSGIRVNAVCPGVISTPMIERGMAEYPDFEQQLRAYQPVGRMGTPEEVAETTLHLCSDASSFTTGVALPLDGGVTAR